MVSFDVTVEFWPISEPSCFSGKQQSPRSACLAGITWRIDKQTSKQIKTYGQPTNNQGLPSFYLLSQKETLNTIWLYFVLFTTKIQAVSRLLCSFSFFDLQCLMQGRWRAKVLNRIAFTACKEEKIGSSQFERTKLNFPLGTQIKQVELQNRWSLWMGVQ